MSHAEIWDDSALVDSWNEALQEYKKYHSISARGERVEDVLKASQEQLTENGDGKDYEDGEVSEAPAKESISKAAHQNTRPNGEGTRDKQTVAIDPTASHTVPKVPVLPQHLIGQVHDEGLKNMLMAWYYAGYYTGLHEGRQEVSGSVKPST